MLRENDLLQLIAGHNAALPAAVTIPPGDDMGALRLGNTELLIAVDPLIEAVHFDRSHATLEQIGRKALTRNLSDVAAMAARPVAAVCAALLPRAMSRDDAARLFDAVRSTGESYGCPVIGGDIAVVDGPLSLTVTVLAEPAGIEPVRRRTARPGDVLYVTGQLGHSHAGHHLDFEPRLRLARSLAGHPATRPSAMMDLSDGLAMDLPRLCEHAAVHADRLPVRDGTLQPRWQHALGDGEDYELLFALPPQHAGALPGDIDGVALTRIGQVRAAGGVVFLDADAQPLDTTALGWEHRG